MRLTSKLPKILSSFVERYRVFNLLRIVAFLLFIWVVGATWLYFTEKDYQLTAAEIQRGEKNYFDSYPHALKNTLVYLFSGFEEYLPHTLAGWFGSVLVMLVGSLGVVAFLIGNVVSIIQERIKEAKLIKKKPAHSHFEGHLVICNWSDKGINILRQVRDPSTGFSQPIVIVSEQANTIGIGNDKALFEDVWAVVGDPTLAGVLSRADIQHAETVLILADTGIANETTGNGVLTLDWQTGPGTFSPEMSNHTSLIDAKTILVGMTIEAMCKHTYTCVELLDARNKVHLERTHINEVICGQEFSSKLLAQASVCHGLTKVHQHLLTATGNTNEIYISELPESFIGQTFETAKRRVRTLPEDLILLGFQRATPTGQVNRFGQKLYTTRLFLNPNNGSGRKRGSGQTTLQRGDKLIIMAYRKPNLAELVMQTNSEDQS